MWSISVIASRLPGFGFTPTDCAANQSSCGLLLVPRSSVQRPRLSQGLSPPGAAASLRDGVDILWPAVTFSDMSTSEAAVALGRLRERQGQFVAARQERQAAILDCVRSSVPLRDVARVAECSHETVRRVVAADRSAILAWEAATFALSGPTVGLLVYKLAGYAQGTLGLRG